MRFVSICEQWEGRTVDGKFPLLEWLGGSANQGVFLTVRQGIQTANIKLILAAGSDAGAYLAQWEASKALSHPNLVQVMETGRYVIDGQDLVYAVTERAEAVLSGITAKKPLEPGKTQAILKPVVDALAYVHEKGFVHGHVKPSNIVLVADQWKLSADGLVVAGKDLKMAPEPGVYDAPEVSAGKLTTASDVWSLGITVAEALAKRIPEWDNSAKGDPVLPESLPQPFLDIVRGSLRWDPAQRCSITEIRTLLGRDTAPTIRDTTLTILEEPGPDRAETKPVEDEKSPVATEPIPVVEGRNAAVEVSPEHVAYPFGKVEPVEPARISSLFSNFEEEEERRVRVAPILLGIIVLLAVVAGFFVMRGYRIKLWRPADTQPAPAASQPAPQPRVPSAENAPATEQAVPEMPSAAAPGASQTPPTPGQSATESQTPAEARGTSPTGQPTQQTQAPGTAAGAPPSVPEAGKAAEELNPAGVALHAANTRGAVLKQVLPNVAPGASESMRAAPVQVEVRVWVDENGTVSNADYVTSGPGNYFARISRQAALSWEFRAPKSEGRARSSVWTLEFYFERRRTEVTATEIR